MKKLNSPIPWVGGKRLLRHEIISRFPEHNTYIEPFAGAAWVYWGKEPSTVEVINDLNGDLVNLFLTIKNHPEEFYDRLWYMKTSRELYKKSIEVIESGAKGLDDIDRAVYFFYSIKNAFAGRFASGFAFSKKQPPRSAIGLDFVQELSQRLENTYIENLPYQRIIKNYDSPESFFYCDPPYVVADGTKYYQHVFTPDMHIDLKNRLSKIKGKFLLSYDDVPTIRELYKDFNIKKTKPVRYTLNQKSQYKQELFITNY